MIRTTRDIVIVPAAVLSSLCRIIINYSLIDASPSGMGERVGNTVGVLVTLICLITTETVLATPVVRADTFQLTILHNNDMHARFVETDGWSNTCSNENALNHKCYGGFARVAHL